MKMTVLTLALLSVLSACATAPEKIQASFVPTTQYAGLNCQQLNRDAVRVNNELTVASGQQKQAASNDAAMTAVSLILFWPAAFFIGGDGDAPNISRLKGEASALSAAGKSRGCGA